MVSTSVFLLGFRAIISADMTRLFLELVKLGFLKIRFLSGILIIPKHLRKTIENFGRVHQFSQDQHIFSVLSPILEL